MTPFTPALPVDRLAVGYQLKLHLPGISPQISRRVLGRGHTTLAELHHVFQVVLAGRTGTCTAFIFGARTTA